MELFNADILNEAEENRDDGAILKRGYIVGVNGPEYFETGDYYEVPECPCGQKMREGERVLTQEHYENVKAGLPELPWERIEPGMILYHWWCDVPGCRQAVAEHWRNRRRNRHREELARIPEEVLRRYGIPDAYSHCTLDTYLNNPQAVKYFRDYLIDPDHSLLLTGGTGTGKTHLAVAILRELHVTGETKLFFRTVVDLLVDITSSFSSGESSHYGEFIDRLSGYDWLVLDDLGAEKPTEFAVTTLYTIINRRLNFNKHTIVTTNLSLDNIRTQLSERIASRLAGYTVIPFKMPDYRKRRYKKPS